MTDINESLHQLGLHQIECGVSWLKQQVSRIEEGVINVGYRHNWTTNAEVSLEKAEDALIDALSRVRELQALYAAKPVFVKERDVDLRNVTHMLSLEAAE